MFSIACDCRIVEIPPKPMTKVQVRIFPILPKEDEMSVQPFVISIIPSRMEATLGENRLKSGESEDITTKKIVMTTPIDNTETKVSKMMSEREISLSFFIVCGINKLSALIFLYKRPFIKAPII